MDVTVEDAGPCRKVLRIRAGADEVAGDYDAVVSQYMRHAKVSGFRPGKAPRAVIEKRYGKDIDASVKDDLVARLYRTAAADKKLRAVAVVDVQDVEFDKSMGAACRITVDVAPDFELPPYGNIPIQEQPVLVAEEDVTKQVDALRQRFGRFEDVEGRPVKEGDLVRVDFTATCEGRPMSEVAKEAEGLNEAKDFMVIAGEPEFLPGFGRALIGASAGENREVPVAFPEDYQIKPLSNRTAMFAVAVKGIRERIPADIDAEFCKRFGAEDEAGLRNLIEEDLLEGRRAEEVRRQKGEVIRYLLERAQFDLPQSVVEDERRMMIRNLLRQIVDSGATREQIEEQQQSILDAASKSSAERVRLMYILSRIAAEEKIEVPDEEVDAQIRALAQRSRMSEEQMRDELNSRHAIEAVRQDLRSEKTLNFLLEKSKKG